MFIFDPEKRWENKKEWDEERLFEGNDDDDEEGDQGPEAYDLEGDR